MSDNFDDLDAVKTIINTLEPFDTDNQQRIVRWALEKIGLELGQDKMHQGGSGESTLPENGDPPPPPGVRGSDIKTFVAEKKPSSDNQFAATVAYYYEFEAPTELRKESISATDLQEACRQIGRSRLGDPGKTLRNAHGVGLLDKASERGFYRINTVGENLVAVTLPSGTSSTVTSSRKKGRKKKGASKKKKKI